MNEPTIEITYNGMKYYSEVALAENQLKWYNLGKAVGIEEGKKSNGISKKEIPGEYLAHIEEARLEGYADGYKDCREIVEHILKYGRDEDGVE
jgi:hypothetical protein